MKRLVCFALSVMLVLYGCCYIKKAGSDNLPTLKEYHQYIDEKKETVIDLYHTTKDWFISKIDS